MRIRLATFNVENLFDRPVAMNFPKWSKGQPILDAYNKLNTLLNKEVYTEADKQDILELLKTYGLLVNRPDDEYRYFWLRKSKGQLVRIHKDKPPEIVANGRSD
ncbi:MAG: hypothetical protein MUO26_04575 [Methanotrichaceae archaeon]|nr:hypothetical protein [Methanotrichaceae archaeon]